MSVFVTKFCKTHLLLLFLSIHFFIDTVLYNSFKCSLHHFTLYLIILNWYEYFKFIELNPQLNSVESFITHFSSDSSVSYHNPIINYNGGGKKFRQVRRPSQFVEVAPFACWRNCKFVLLLHRVNSTSNYSPGENLFPYK